MRETLTFTIIFTLALLGARAQQSKDPVTGRTDTTKIEPASASTNGLLVSATKDATKLKTGQANDLITNFYQLAVKNIFGSKKELSYTTTIFGLIDSVNHGKYDIDTFYRKTKWARNIELTASGKIDSNNKVTSYSAGVKFYLINKRDITAGDKELTDTMAKYEMALTDIGKARRQCFGSKNITAINESITKFYSTLDISDLHPELVAVLKSMNSLVVQGKGAAKMAHDYFDQQINKIKQKPLWTLGGNYFHSITDKSDTVKIQSDFLVGFGKQKNFWEFTASSYLQLFDNNSKPASAGAQKFHFETGVNKILTTTSDGRSNMELKGFGSFDKGFNIANDTKSIKANVTYRYLVSMFSGFWIPVTLSYDPSKGKLFGFVDLTFNIDPQK